MKKKMETKRMVLLAVLMGILLLMSFTPLGYLNIGPLAVTLNMIPVAIGAIALGPSAGAVLGAVFGITSCLQCIGFGGSSAMGAAMFGINPTLTWIQRFVPRLCAGWFVGWVYVQMKKLTKSGVIAFIAGFLAAFMNTVLFMGALIGLFWNTDYLQDLVNGQNVLVFVCTFVGINALVEMLASTVIVGSVCVALKKSHLIGGK